MIIFHLKEENRIKSETFGLKEIHFLSDDEFMEFYQTTGIDVDDRMKRNRYSCEVKI